ncbi:hypothetical protein THAOC_17750 [Thalassiosira oceanica]|uniref:Uncharacterized protein n=1 Tax=Thalassiosira oceanica TaxID=159749 RepID=K0SU34_THAOC|nr:hypothetical protein THAOC_17750 [Thalassiosira oceanica]|eukprot:EJK61717.1 hypothetical protein THAOC_17750 [Thalassiosira oceanica]
MPGTWLWRSGRYVLHRETNASWRLGFWPEADMSSFPGVCSQHYTLYRSGPSGDGNDNEWEVVPSAEGSTPELSTSARVSVRGGKVSRLDDPSTAVEVIGGGGAVIRSEGGDVAGEERVRAMKSAELNCWKLGHIMTDKGMHITSSNKGTHKKANTWTKTSFTS